MDDLRKAYRTASVIGLAMIASVFIYAGIVEMVKSGTIPLGGDPSLPADELSIMKFALLGVTAVLFVMAKVITGKILSIDDTGPVRVAQGRGLGAAPEELQRLVTSAVVSYALSEAPAIFGLVLFFLGRNSADFYLFMLLSLFFFSRYFPKYGTWEEWVKRKGRPT